MEPPIAKIVPQKRVIKKWTMVEDAALKEMVTEHGTKCWALIASKLGEHNRTGKQCRERWHNQLDPSINKDQWTEEEERILVEAQSRLGNGITLPHPMPSLTLFPLKSILLCPNIYTYTILPYPPIPLYTPLFPPIPPCTPLYSM